MDLKSFRENKLKITQQHFAELIDEDLSKISIWEENGEPPLSILQKIVLKTGTDFNTLLGWEKPMIEPLIVEDNWLKADFTKRSLADYINDALQKMNLPDEQRKAYIDDLRQGINTNLVKPKIAIVGRSDTGKSTMINALLGMDKMPTSWTPTTSIAVYIKHKVDKPAYIKEDTWIFADCIENEEHWNEQRLYDEEYCRKWKIEAGSIDILQSYGTRQGDDYAKRAGSAVVFIDAPILSNCDIIDLPGFGTETDSDDNITFNVTKSVDAIIYLSQANGFMRIEDITYLKRNISELPIWEKKEENDLEPLCNLFVVGSQAHTVNGGNKEQLTEIFNNGCKRLIGTFPDHYWNNREEVSGYSSSDYSKTELRRRFFAYTTDIPDICTRFNSSLKKITETLPVVINNRAKAFVSEFIKMRKPNLENEIQKYEGIISEREKYVSLLKEIDGNERNRVLENDKRKNEMRSEILHLKSESISEFSTFCTSSITIDGITELIKKRGIKNKKEEVEQFGSWFQGHLQEQCESILKDKSEMFSKKAEGYIKAFAESISTAFETNDIKADFDSSWAFISALAQYGVWGGLGGLIAGFGAILFGSMSLLSGSLGIAAISAVGLGPIGILLGIALTAGLSIAKIFGGGWEKSVAKKIVKAIDENNITEQFRKGIEDYWKQTEDAFNNASDALDKDWKEYVENLRKTVDGYDVNDMQRKINALRNIESFFENIPL